jgi:acylphosphatase
MTRAVEVRITGDVQGVSFRMYAAREADRLGLTGWVRNHPDAAVEARFQGEDRSVEEMLRWCRTGSPAAHVEDVGVHDVAVDDAASPGFSVVE